MGQLVKKKRPAHVLTPGQMLQTLQQEPQMTALLQHKAIWLAVTPRTAWILDMCCTGQMEGGPGTAHDTANTLGLILPPPDAITPLNAQVADASQPCSPPAAKRLKSDSQADIAAASSGNPASNALVNRPTSDLQPREAADVDVRNLPQIQQAMQVEIEPELAAQRAAADDAQQETGQLGTEGHTEQSLQPCQRMDVAPAETPPPVRQSRSRRRSSKPEVPAPWAAMPHQWVSVRLTLEEAFFLQHILRCLVVKAASTSIPGLPTSQIDSSTATGTAAAAAAELVTLDDQALWTACCTIRPNFPTSYVGYHHLKCKGWLPRSGLLYGVDYVVYSLHPAAMHSHFAVLLQPLHAGTPAPTPPVDSNQPHGAEPAALANVLRQGQPPNDTSFDDDDRDGDGHDGTMVDGKAGRPAGAYDMQWHDLQITSRVVSTVSKRLLLLYLLQLPSSPGHDTPACLEHYRVEERFVRRWVPDATRD